MRGHTPARVIVLALLLAIPRQSRGELCPTPAPEIENPYAFISAYVDALAHANLAWSYGEDVSKKDGPKLAELMMAEIQVEGGLECGLSIITPYSQSKTQLIQAAAEVAANQYRSLIAEQKQVIELYQEAIDGGRPGETPGAWTERLAKVMAGSHDDWLQFIPISTMATYPIGEKDPATGKPRLLLTEAERLELLKKLTGIFGESLQEGPAPGQTPPYTGAAVIYKALADKSIKSHDAK